MVQQTTGDNGIQKAVRSLVGLNAQELSFVTRTINVARRRKLPVQKASSLLSLMETKTKVVFKDNKGIPHVGIIRKINQKYANVFDESIKRGYSILPDNLKPATKEDEEKASTVKAEPRKKRAYTRRKLADNATIKKDEKGNIIFGRRASDKTTQ